MPSESLKDLPPGDPELVSDIVDRLKKEGLFDQFRKDFLSDIDTKPAFQHLRSKVVNYVSLFLDKYKWKPDLNKNQIRDNLRRHVNQWHMLSSGMDRIVEQVIDPQINQVLRPEVAKFVYDYLGVEPVKQTEQKSFSYGAPQSYFPYGFHGMYRSGLFSDNKALSTSQNSATEEEEPAPLPSEPPPPDDVPAPPPEPAPDLPPVPSMVSIPPVYNDDDDIAAPPVEPLSPVRCEIIVEDTSAFELAARDPNMDVTEAEPMDIVDSSSGKTTPVDALLNIPLPEGMPTPLKQPKSRKSRASTDVTDDEEDSGSVTVSSVHTSDLSDFDDEISLSSDDVEYLMRSQSDEEEVGDKRGADVATIESQKKPSPSTEQALPKTPKKDTPSDSALIVTRTPKKELLKEQKLAEKKIAVRRAKLKDRQNMKKEELLTDIICPITSIADVENPRYFGVCARRAALAKIRVNHYLLNPPDAQPIVHKLLKGKKVRTAVREYSSFQSLSEKHSTEHRGRMNFVDIDTDVTFAVKPGRQTRNSAGVIPSAFQAAPGLTHERLKNEVLSSSFKVHSSRLEASSGQEEKHVSSYSSSYSIPSSSLDNRDHSAIFRHRRPMHEPVTELHRSRTRATSKATDEFSEISSDALSVSSADSAVKNLPSKYRQIKNTSTESSSSNSEKKSSQSSPDSAHHAKSSSSSDRNRKQQRYLEARRSKRTSAHRKHKTEKHAKWHKKRTESEVSESSSNTGPSSAEVSRSRRSSLSQRRQSIENVSSETHSSSSSEPKVKKKRKVTAESEQSSSSSQEVKVNKMKGLPSDEGEVSDSSRSSTSSTSQGQQYFSRQRQKKNKYRRTSKKAAKHRKSFKTNIDRKEWRDKRRSKVKGLSVSSMSSEAELGAAQRSFDADRDVPISNARFVHRDPYIEPYEPNLTAEASPVSSVSDSDMLMPHPELANKSLAVPVSEGELEDEFPKTESKSKKYVVTRKESASEEGELSESSASVSEEKTPNKEEASGLTLPERRVLEASPVSSLSDNEKADEIYNPPNVEADNVRCDAVEDTGEAGSPISSDDADLEKVTAENLVCVEQPVSAEEGEIADSDSSDAPRITPSSLPINSAPWKPAQQLKSNDSVAQMRSKQIKSFDVKSQEEPEEGEIGDDEGEDDQYPISPISSDSIDDTLKNPREQKTVEISPVGSPVSEADFDMTTVKQSIPMEKENVCSSDSPAFVESPVSATQEQLDTPNRATVNETSEISSAEELDEISCSSPSAAVTEKRSEGKKTNNVMENTGNVRETSKNSTIHLQRDNVVSPQAPIFTEPHHSDEISDSSLQSPSQSESACDSEPIQPLVSMTTDKLGMADVSSGRGSGSHQRSSMNIKEVSRGSQIKESNKGHLKELTRGSLADDKTELATTKSKGSSPGEGSSKTVLERSTRRRVMPAYLQDHYVQPLGKKQKYQ